MPGITFFKQFDFFCFKFSSSPTESTNKHKMNGPLCGLIPSEVFQITNDRMRLYELNVVWESICLTVKIQLLSLPIIPVVFLNCEVAHTSFSVNLWTLHNSIWLWLPDKQMLCLFKHVLFIFRMSTKFSHIWWEIQFGQLDLVTLNYVFLGQGFKKRGQWHIYMCLWQMSPVTDSQTRGKYHSYCICTLQETLIWAGNSSCL